MVTCPSTHPAQLPQHVLPVTSRLNSKDVAASVEMLKQLGQLETNQYAADPKYNGVEQMVERL